MDPIRSRRDILAGAVALPFLGTPALAQSGRKGEGLLARLRAAKSVTVGVANFPPYSGIDPDGALTGVVPTIGKLIMTRLGVPQMRGLPANYGQLIPGMQAGRWDFICTALTISKARCSQVLFCDPIVFDGPSIVSLKRDLPDPPKRLADLVARKLIVGVSAGGAIARLSLTAGVSPANLRQFPDVVSMVEGLVAKRVQVIFQDRASVVRVCQQRGLDYDLQFPVPDAPEHGSGCAFRMQDADLYEAFQKELRAMKASGEYLSIAKRFGFDTTPGQMAIDAKAACASA